MAPLVLADWRSEDKRCNGKHNMQKNEAARATIAIPCWHRSKIDISLSSSSKVVVFIVVIVKNDPLGLLHLLAIAPRIVAALPVTCGAVLTLFSFGTAGSSGKSRARARCRRGLGLGPDAQVVLEVFEVEIEIVVVVVIVEDRGRRRSRRRHGGPAAGCCTWQAPTGTSFLDRACC